MKCTSLRKVTEILEKTVKQSWDDFSELRILDIRAGNEIMGLELSKHGIPKKLLNDLQITQLTHEL